MSCRSCKKCAFRSSGTLHIILHQSASLNRTLTCIYLHVKSQLFACTSQVALLYRNFNIGVQVLLPFPEDIANPNYAKLALCVLRVYRNHWAILTNDNIDCHMQWDTTMSRSVLHMICINLKGRFSGGVQLSAIVKVKTMIGTTKCPPIQCSFCVI